MNANVERAGAAPPRHQVLGRIGRGGMASVYLALCRGANDFQRLAVIKKLHAELLDDPSIRTMFRDEGRLAARLNHPNVVQTYEFAELDGQDVIVMEYLEGQPLSQLMVLARQLKCVLSPRFAARVLSDALSGLDYVHRCKDFDGCPLGVVHRDLSPQNLFITYEGNVKLVDFGVAKAAMTERAATRVGSVKGKLAYMAPEQVNGETVDARTDVFAAGVVLWELLAAERLIGNRSTAESVAMIVAGEFPVLARLKDDIPTELSNIVARALEREPGNRFDSARAMRDALETFLASSGPPVRSEEVAAVMHQVFSTQRESRQRSVQRWLADATTPSSTSSGSRRVASAPRSPSVAPLNDLPRSPSVSPCEATLLTAEMPSVRPRVRRVGIAFAALLTMGFGFWLAAVTSLEADTPHAAAVTRVTPPAHGDSVATEATPTTPIDAKPASASASSSDAPSARTQQVSASPAESEPPLPTRVRSPHTPRRVVNTSRPRPALARSEDASARPDVTLELDQQASRAPLLPAPVVRAPLLSERPASSKTKANQLELVPARTETSP